MIGQLQQTPRNYAAWSHRQPFYMPQNPTMFSRPPTFNAHMPYPVNYTGRVKWNRNDKRRVNPDNLSETNQFTGNVRRFHFPKRRFTGGGHISAPFAPHNTTSFIIRAKKSGGVASQVSPCATTPTILTTPTTLSPSTEVVVEMAKEKWRVDEYGTMKGLIRVRSEKENFDKTENNASEHLEFEKTLNTDLRRFEMIYPNENSLENRVHEHEIRITRLEEHNLTLKERIFIIEAELGELKRRVLCLETEKIRLHDLKREDVHSEKSVRDDDDN